MGIENIFTPHVIATNHILRYIRAKENSIGGAMETLVRTMDDELEIIAIARDGKEAVEMILNTEPDVVLLDVIMPHLDGIGVLERINAAKMKKNPLCIMLSAVGQDKITQRYLIRFNKPEL